MKKTIKNKIISIFTVILLLALAMGLASCGGGNNNKTTAENEYQEPVYVLEKGIFFEGAEIYLVSNYTIAYRSEKDTFDINDVRLTVLYGGCFAEDIDEELQKNSFPYFSINVINEKGSEIVVKNVYEEFVSEKYRTTWQYDTQKGDTTIEYKHAEEIIIPSHVFVSQKGSIVITLAHEYMYFSDITLFYEKNGDTVILSSKEIK